MKLVVEMVALSTCPRSAEAMASPVLAATVGPSDDVLVDGNAVWLLLKFTRPWGSGTWKNGNFTWRNSAPTLMAWAPLLIATLWTKSQTLLYSRVGLHSAPPKLV